MTFLHDQVRYVIFFTTRESSFKQFGSNLRDILLYCRVPHGITSALLLPSAIKLLKTLSVSAIKSFAIRSFIRLKIQFQQPAQNEFLRLLYLVVLNGCQRSTKASPRQTYRYDKMSTTSLQTDASNSKSAKTRQKNLQSQARLLSFKLHFKF